jgi:chloride channel 3/4/5
MISKWVGDAFDRGGLDDAIIRLKNYPYLSSNDDALPMDCLVERVMTRVEELIVLSEAGHTVEELEELLEVTRYHGFPIVRSIQDMKLVGFINRQDLQTALSKLIYTLTYC